MLECLNDGKSDRGVAGHAPHDEHEYVGNGRATAKVGECRPRCPRTVKVTP